MPNVTSVWDFSPGETLTAAKLDDVNCGIHVFSGTATRDAAYGGSGERTLEEGEFAYLADTNTTQYYDGSAWQTVGLTPGLRYITGNSFSAVSSFSLPNDTFTTTYRNYKVIVVVSSASTALTVTSRMRTAGTDNSNSNYIFGSMAWSVSALTLTNQSAGTTSWTTGRLDPTTYGYGAMNLDIYSPQLAARTLVSGSTPEGGAASYWGQTIFGSAFTTTTQFDSMSFICSTGNITGTYRVYGYSES